MQCVFISRPCFILVVRTERIRELWLTVSEAGTVSKEKKAIWKEKRSSHGTDAEIAIQVPSHFRTIHT